MSAARKEQWVLVVDDDPDVRELLVEDLIDQFDGNLRIVEAADGVQATGKLDNQVFDCIVTDLKMPKRDGAHFIEWVRESSLNRHSPIVVVTGYPDPMVVERFPNIHFLDKPVNFKTFGDTIRTQLKLGRVDKRVSADLFNFSVDSARRFFGKVLETIPVVERPDPKPAGVDPKGDLTYFIAVNGPYGRCDFSIGFSSTSLEVLGAGKSLDKLAIGATSTILKSMLTSYHMAYKDHQVPKVKSKHLVENIADPLFGKMRSSTGLVVPITFFEHVIYLTMYHNFKA